MMTDREAVDQKKAMHEARHALETGLTARKEALMADGEEPVAGPFTVTPDGSIEPLELLAGAPNTQLEQLQGIVGGYIEVVPVYGSDYYMVCDEEGKLKGKETNPLATRMLQMSPHDCVVGTVVVVHNELLA